MNPGSLPVLFKLTLTAVFWGGTFIAGRILAGHVGPFSAAFLRFASATVVLAAVVVLRGRGVKRPDGTEMFTIAILGLTGVFAYNFLFFKGLETVPASRASLIIATNPVFISLLAAALFKEPFNAVKGGGIILSVAGAMVAITQGNLSIVNNGVLGWGDLMIAGCVASWVTFSLVGKNMLNRMPPLVVITYASAFGAVALAVPACREGLLASLSSYRPVDWISILYLGICGTALGFVWYYEGIERIGAMKASLFINLVPISAIVMASFLLSEPITISLLLGTVMVVVGVYFTNTGSLLLPAQPTHGGQGLRDERKQIH